MIYLLHFDKPYKHARHYLGYTESEDTFAQRLEDHAAGRGARLLAVITAAGIGWTLAAVLPGDRTEERRLKNTAHPERICPVCKALAKNSDGPKLKTQEDCNVDECTTQAT